MNPNPVNPVNPVKTASHTPGPWKTEALIQEVGFGEKHRVAYVNAQSETVAQCWLTGCDRGLADETRLAETRANARLIAAAPELLALASKLAVLPVHSPEWLENPSVRVDLSAAVYAARAAVAKAQGEG